ncbi:MAG: DNA polymerase I [Microthrixaceae bacterium]
MATVMLIDGNSLTYRAFHALPTDLQTSSGQVTNAVFGFTSMVLNLVRDHRPDGVVVAFDLPEKTFRHEMVETYKANRDAAPDILRQQMGLVRQVTETFALPILEAPGYEADDIIATLATNAAGRGDDVIIVTGDRDSYQLVEDPHVKVLYNRRGVSDYALYDEAGILDRTGVAPTDYVTYAALRGDNSDNLPGVPGVGEKTAAKLVNTYGDLDGLFAAVEEQTPKLRQNLTEHEQQARSNYEMMKLVRDVPLDFDDTVIAMGDFDPDAVVELFNFLEFPSLVARLPEAFPELFGEGTEAVGTAHKVLEAEVTVASDSAGVSAAVRKATKTGRLVVAGGWVDEIGHSPLVGVALATDPEVAEVAWIPSDLLGEGLTEALCGDVPVVAHDAKPLVRSLLGIGADLTALAEDTELAAYLIDPSDASYSLSALLSRYAEAELAGAEQVPEGQLDLEGDSEGSYMAPARRALGVAHLVDPLAEALDARGLRALADDIEIPLVRVLAKMEHVGVGVDRAVLEDLRDSLVAECESERAAIVECAGEDFNVNSTPQLRTILFDKLGLPPQKKTKTGPSTDHQTLEKLRGSHDIIEHLLRYREVEKLRSTYGEGLLAEVGPDDRIHATFNQTVARTGRLSSDRPNLHNIPVRTDEGRRFREAFVPSAGTDLLVADYNQIELRCIAHLSEDPGLVEAFTSGADIHDRTASRVFSVDQGEVSSEQRSKAKMVSYGLAYGMEAYGLAQRLNIATGEAQEILDAYFEAFPSVRDFMDRTVAEARDRGYTETVFGRRRRIPELSSNQRNVRMAGERQAMNAPIQGLAADIFKVALVRLDAALESARAAGDDPGTLILQVHDEVLVEVPPNSWDATEAMVLDALSGAFDLRVPLEVNLSRGKSWAEAKG